MNIDEHEYVTGNQQQTPDSCEHSAWWLAIYVLRAAKAYNASYDQAAANEATKAAPFGTHVNYEQFQKMNERQAAESVCPDVFVEPVYYMLRYTWNDSQDWAKEVIMPACKCCTDSGEPALVVPRA